MRDTMRLILTLSAIVLGLTVTAADAGEDQTLTYEMFEASVPHIDLETCPADLAQQDTFCRASIHHEEIHVFAFSLDGDSPLVGFKSYEASGVETLLN